MITMWLEYECGICWCMFNNDGVISGYAVDSSGIYLEQ